MRPFWINSGLALLDIDEHGSLLITDDFLRAYLLRPELAPVDESCPAECALHERLLSNPTEAVSDDSLGSLADRDAKENYQLFLRFRQRLISAPCLQAAYLTIFHDARRDGRVDIPPLFIDQMTQIIMHQILVAEEDPVVLRTAELWFREQRVTLDDGRVVVADSQALERLADPGMGELGRLLAAGGLAAGEQTVEVLNKDNAANYFGRDEEFDFALEITHGRPGATALADLVGRWVRYLLGVDVRVRTVGQIDDAHWRWHVGLDAAGSDLLNVLYQDGSLDPDQTRRLLLLARLEFENLNDQAPDVAGKPVYLAVGMSDQGLLRLKPQNLLLNLPITARH
ncbi:MAG: DUF6352 family protein [Burkholderiaceae bacterium]